MTCLVKEVGVKVSLPHTTIGILSVPVSPPCILYVSVEVSAKPVVLVIYIAAVFGSVGFITDTNPDGEVIVYEVKVQAPAIKQ